MGINARKSVFGVCEQQRRRPASASAHADQRLCYLFFGKKIVFNFATSDVSIFLLVSVAKETSLSLSLSENQKTVLFFSHRCPYYC